MNIIKHRNIFFAITGAIVVAAIASIIFFGLPLSIDFTGGSLVEVTYDASRPELAKLQSNANALSLGEVSVRETGANSITLRARTLTPEEHLAVLNALSLEGASTLKEDKFTSIGPSLGSELATKALYAIVAVILSIVLYIAWAFRKVSRPISSWIYGLAIIVILVHDIVVPAGFYALWAHFTGGQVDTLVIVALLAILGYSVNDTIVIFDRVREHLKNNEEKNIKESYEETVGKSIMETLTRSINTSLTVVLALLAIIFVGSPATFNFTLVLIAGVIAGTYSSILIAAPLLVPLAKRFANKN